MEDLSAADAQIDRELQQALAGEPSPQFVARVRERVAGEMSPSTAWWRWRLAPAALTAAAVVLAIVVLRWSPDDRRGTANGAQVPLTARAVVPLEDVAATWAVPRVQESAAPGALSASFVAGVQHVPPPEASAPGHVRPRVLISPGEAAALRRLLADVGAGRFAPASLPDRRASAALIESPVEIAVQPITIELIQVHTLETAGALQ